MDNYCKFCSEIANDDFDVEQCKDNKKNIKAFILYRDLVLRSSSGDFAYYQINYCPMCGRSLEGL